MLNHRSSDARPMVDPPKGGLIKGGADMGRTRLVAAIVLAAWVTLATVRRSLGPVMK